MAEVQKFSKVKLVDLSLKCIIKNFGRYIDARAAGDTIPARNFYFLQKLFSKQLFRELANTKYFVENMEFFLNPYLKEVDLDLCHHDSDITEIIERLKVIGETITTLVLSGTLFSTDVILELPSHLPNVKSVIFCFVEVTDKALANIGKYCKMLEILTIANSYEVTDVGIQALCPASENSNVSICKTHSLQHLDVHNTCVSTIGIAFVLKHFPNIKSIQHDDVLSALCNIHADDLKNGSHSPFQTYKLQELHVGYEFAEVSVLKLCALLCPHVAKLDISKITSQAQITACAEFVEVTKVYFRMTYPSANLSSFVKSRGKNLEILHIRDGVISAESLLKFCPNLKCLNLEKSQFEPIIEFKSDSLGYTFEQLEHLTLNEMNFGNHSVVDSAKLLLSTSPNLKVWNILFADSLSLNFIDYINALNGLVSVQEIDVSFSSITAPVANKLLLAVPNLKLFIVQHCNITFEEYKIMKSLQPTVKINWKRYKLR